MNKDAKKKTLEVVARIVMATAVKEADSACLLFAYQPKMPDELKRRKK